MPGSHGNCLFESSTTVSMGLVPRSLSQFAKDFPGGSDGKASAYNMGNPGLIPGSEGSPGAGNGNPLQYPCLESLVSYSPWGRKELDTTERLHFHFTLSFGALSFNSSHLFTSTVKAL